MIIDIAKRDAVRIFCERLFEWLAKQTFSASPSDSDPAYRRGWNDCLKHTQRHLSR